MRVAIYARVSTTNGQSPQMQLSDLREYASRRGWEVFAEYIDNGVSGAKESRPELNRLMTDAHRRHFDVVLCWKVDRFGRSLKHMSTPSLISTRTELLLSASVTTWICPPRRGG